jgi:hypothetical protein
MLKFTTVAVATIIGLGSASADTFLERLTGYSRDAVTPIENAPSAGNSIPPGWQDMRSNAPFNAVIKPAEPTPGWHKKVTLYHEQGGLIGQHWERFKLYADRNDEVELLGECYSACTLVMSLLPRERICIGAKASLHFHQARYGDGQPADATTHMMYQSYPEDIRAWLDSKGGELNLPMNEYWSLLATDLWKMGYRRCGPG